MVDIRKIWERLAMFSHRLEGVEERGSMLVKWMERHDQELQAIREQMKTYEKGQEEVLEALEKIYEALDEFLAKERPEASQAAQDVAERLLAVEEELEKIWDAVENLEKHAGLSS